MRVIALTTLGFFVNVASGWSALPHIIIATIAQLNMKPNDVAAINRILQKWDTMYPYSIDISTASVWPDLIKNPNYGSPRRRNIIRPMHTWHFMNKNIYEEGFLGTEDTNTTVAVGTLTNEYDDDDEIFNNSQNPVFILEKSLNDFTNPKRMKNYNSLNNLLRYTIHGMGDIHQMLHTSNMHTMQFEDGDEGGNKWKFAKPSSQDTRPYRNLHSLWDNAGGALDSLNKWDIETDLPLKTRRQYERKSRELMEKYRPSPLIKALDLPYSDFSLTMSRNSVFRKIVTESANLAPSVVYTEKLPRNFVSPNKLQHPGKEYIQEAQHVCEERMVTAGLRLGVFLSQFASQLQKYGPNERVQNSTVFWNSV